MKFRRKLKNSLKKEIDSEPVYNKKYLKAQRYPIMEKSTQIFIIIKYPKKVLNLFVYQ